MRLGTISHEGHWKKLGHLVWKKDDMVKMSEKCVFHKQMVGYTTWKPRNQLLMTMFISEFVK